MSPLVSVLICVKNMDQFISGCLKSILTQSFKDLEIVIIDDSTSDGTEKIVKEINDNRIRYFKNIELSGLSKSRNQSVKFARGEFVFFTDADCQVSENWICEGLKSFKKMGALGIEGKTYYVSEVYQPTRSDSFMENRIGGGFLTCNIAYRKDVLEGIRGFDERFTYLEDRDLAIRVQAYGKIVFNPKMLVYHQKRTISPKQFIQSAKIIRNRVLLYKKGDKPSDLFLGRIAYPKDLIKIIFPVLIFGSLVSNNYLTKEDKRIFSIIYLKLVWERINLWQMCAKERVFLL
jgi:glycosyltransferase involved in cell wall biosynthesis